jgi:hypothetical protein
VSGGLPASSHASIITSEVTVERREYLKRLAHYGGCIGCLPVLNLGGTFADARQQNDDCDRLKTEKEFVQNWLTDLMNTIDKELDEPSKQKLMAGTGRGCYDRHTFKQDIATKGKGSLEALIEAYKQNFEIWREGNRIHIRYGKAPGGCFCPAARYRPPTPNDLHCDCTRNTHKTIFETALGREVEVTLLETQRRGGKTCHLLVEV